jgi:hypothetical protein
MSVIFVDNGQMVVCALGQETLGKRVVSLVSVPDTDDAELG